MRARAVLTTLPILGIGLGVYLRVIRPWQLRWGATDDELRRTMPGDELVTRPTFNATRAVTVAAPPSLIWPWIVQIGFGRAGWYSYDLLDNLGRPSATRIVAEFQHLQAGDLVPFYRGIGAPQGVGLKVKALQPEQWVLWWDDRTQDTTWTWALDPVDERRTRLITRVRMRYRWTKPSILFSLLVEVADLVMMRKCLLSIKQRAERLATTPPGLTPQESQGPAAVAAATGREREGDFDRTSETFDRTFGLPRRRRRRCHRGRPATVPDQGRRVPPR